MHYHVQGLRARGRLEEAVELQKQLEQPIDKRSGRIFGPPSGRKLHTRRSIRSRSRRC